LSIISISELMGVRSPSRFPPDSSSQLDSTPNTSARSSSSERDTGDPVPEEVDLRDGSGVRGTKEDPLLPIMPEKVMRVVVGAVVIAVNIDCPLLELRIGSGVKMGEGEVLFIMPQPMSRPLADCPDSREGVGERMAEEDVLSRSPPRMVALTRFPLTGTEVGSGLREGKGVRDTNEEALVMRLLMSIRFIVVVVG